MHYRVVAQTVALGSQNGEVVHYSWLKLNKGRKTQVLKTLFLVIKPEQKFNSKALFEIIDRE